MRELRGYVVTAASATEGGVLLGGSYATGCGKPARGVVLAVDARLAPRPIYEDASLGVSEVRALRLLPGGRTLVGVLVDAVRKISVADAKKILSGGETSVTEFFADKTREPLTGTFLPVVHQSTSRVGVVEKYERVSRKAQGMGLYQPEDPSVDHYVTRKALDGLYFMIGEEEKKIRRDPVGTGSALLGKVFGALR